MSTVYYVDPHGSGAFQSISQAQEAVRQSAALGTSPITVRLRAGVYYLDETLVFTAADSGTASAPVTYAASEGEEVVVSGGAKLDLAWAPWRDGIFRAKTATGLAIDELFVNGQRQHMARYPNFAADTFPYNGYAADAFVPERAAGWANPAGGYIHAMHRHHWGGYHYRITGKNPDGCVAYEGGWQNNRQMGMHDEFRFVENIFEELDAPGEWFHDAAAQTLYFYPPAGVDLQAATIEITRLRHLIEFRGSQEQPVRHITLQGLTFRHAARTFMETREPLLRSDWAIYRGGAVVFEGAEDCAVADCEFDQVGGNAVFASNYNRRLAVRRSHIHGAGASAVCFVGNPDAVRNPLFEYNQRQAYADIDKTPGPKSDTYPGDCIVDDCLIHDVGLVEKQATGVEISMARGITVRHCSIYDVGRAGINISEGTFGGHVLEFCDVFDTVRETGDHGSFNAWGRDRFWQLEGAPDEELASLALLDVEKNTIRNSRWRCDRGWDVDLDDGSSNYEIYNNVFLRGGLKLREGFYRNVYNNIGVNCSLHPHVWYPDSKDQVTRNIWMAPYRPAVMKHWDGAVDHNLFTRDAWRKAFQDKGWDHHSAAGNPMFIDPANGDYRVRPDSPAVALGFQNFPMDRFGVQKASLRAIARTPELPVVDLETPENTEATTSSVPWLGATLKELTGEEFSAFGVGKEEGGMHVRHIEAESLTCLAGLQDDDLVQLVNDIPVPNARAFQAAVQDLPPDEIIRLGVIRHQNRHTLNLSPTSK